jgi:hypothetical protein
MEWFLSKHRDNLTSNLLLLLLLLLLLWRRWEDNIKMDLREVGIDGANWMQLAQDRVQWQAFVNTVMNLRVP